jgi:methylase of polypeptide subunit release factors
MSQHYNQNYTKKEISAVLQKIQECVSSGKYTIAQNENREENIAFIREYNLTSDKQRRLLMQIDVEDFCHTLKNINPGFEHEILYVFCSQVSLFNLNDEEKHLDLYTKFNILDLCSGSRAIVISFHERNKPIDYLFR